jgi:HPt (histidine-containing phosphotransfer) domain-containing protein
MGNSTPLLLRALRVLQTDLQGAPEQLRAQLAQDRVAQARRGMHSLKGVAATVGANALSRVAAGIESQLTTDAPTPERAALIQQLQQAADATARAVHSALNHLQASLPQPPATSPPGPEGASAEQLAADLQALDTLLERSDMQALEAFAALRARYPASLPPTALAAMDQAMQALDFAAAQHHLTTLQTAAASA